LTKQKPKKPPTEFFHRSARLGEQNVPNRLDQGISVIEQVLKIVIQQAAFVKSIVKRKGINRCIHKIKCRVEAGGESRFGLNEQRGLSSWTNGG
jgi:hypothetical protein